MSSLNEIRPLAARSIKRVLRSPPILFSGLLFPIFLYLFNLGGLEFATSLPGFPADSYATFGLSLTFAFCGLYAVLVAGTQLGEDIRTGYVKRVALTPLRGGMLMVGLLAGVTVFACCQVLIFLAVGFIAGASVEAGPGGAALIVGFAALYAVSFGTLGLLFALFTRSGEAVQAMFPLITAALFLSSVMLPRELIANAWYQDVTTYNPVSYVVEAPRSLMIEGWDAQPLLLGVLVSLAVLTTGLLATVTSLRTQAVAR